MKKILLVSLILPLLAACSSPSTEEATLQTGDTQDNTASLMSNIYVVDLGNTTLQPTTIGCEDSLVTVPLDLSGSIDPIFDTLATLLNLPQNMYSNSGRYNALDQSNLVIASFANQGGTVTAYLSWTVMLGGICDNPRFSEQILQTLGQFTGVQTINVYVNNQPLEQFLSMQ